jgi:predicted metal-dependent phosphoesterase TrpH
MVHDPNRPVDLHAHTSFSDGVYRPSELLSYASERGVAALSITDHDTVAAYANSEIFDYADSVGIELIGGVEISAESGRNLGVHVLGLCIDTAEPRLLSVLAGLRENRKEYTTAVVQKIIDQGWQFNLDELEAGQTYTKAHIAGAVVTDSKNQGRLQREFGTMPTRGQYIERYMNRGQLCYVERKMPSTNTAIAAIHDAGGLAFLAHPVAYVYEQGLEPDQIVSDAKKEGFDGIEAIYYYYHKSGGDQEIDKVDLFSGLAKEQGMLITGGSDFHAASSYVGNFMDIGFRDKANFPDVTLLRSIQSAAELRTQI